MKKTICWILLFLGLGNIVSEIVNDFQITTILLASFNPEKHYFRDLLIITKKEDTADTRSLNEICIGYCKSDKLKNTIRLSKKQRIKIGDGLSVWRIKENLKIIRLRGGHNGGLRLNNFEKFKYSIPLFLVISIIPSLIYVLKKMKR